MWSHLFQLLEYNSTIWQQKVWQELKTCQCTVALFLLIFIYLYTSDSLTGHDKDNTKLNQISNPESNGFQ